MASVVVMPALGNSVESCLIIDWTVAEGDEVEVDDTLCEVETDKASMEVPSTAAGTVLKRLWDVGDDVPVMQPLLVVGEPGEDPGPALADAGWGGGDTTPDEGTATADVQPEEERPTAEADDGQPAVRGAATGAASPRARALATSAHVDLGAIAEGSGPGGRIIERDVRAALDSGAATAAAARAGGVASGVEGTGIGGRVSTADLAAAPAPVGRAAHVTGDDEAYVDTPLKGIRKVIAERMMTSLQSSAQVSYTITADAGGLLALRQRFKHSEEALGFTGVTVGDLVGYAAVRAVQLHPSHNSHLVDDVVRSFRDVHLGFACDTPRGLLVPVVRDASALTLRDFSQRSKELAREAIGGTISPDDLTGATFTVSNLGGFGVESFTPVLNHPQSAILGVGAITPRAVVGDDGKVAVEQRIGFSLTADHRVIDGADAARFLQDLVRLVEAIDLTVMG